MRTSLLFAAAVLVVPSVAPAQSPLSVEIGAGVAIPVQDLGNAELGTGFGFGASVRYRFQPSLSAYAGWDWHRFSADLAPDELDVTATDFSFGLRYDRPLGAARPAGEAAPGWWIGGGGILGQYDVEDEAGDSAGDTDYGLGWEAGAGISWPVTDRIAVTPGLRLRMLRREVDMGLGPQDATLTYLAIGVGAAIGF